MLCKPRMVPPPTGLVVVGGGAASAERGSKAVRSSFEFGFEKGAAPLIDTAAGDAASEASDV